MDGLKPARRRVLLTGATGLIGGALARRLCEEGHELLCAGRRPAAFGRWVAVDFGRMSREDWLPHLAGVDVVVNAVGIFREQGEGDFERLHAQAPRVLFEACVSAGVSRVLHLSALGAASDAPTAYLRSKARGDAGLLSLPIDGAVLRPSLVFSPHGTSSRVFLQLAALPVLPLPAGDQLVQPIHLDDVIESMCALVEEAAAPASVRVVDLVGPEPMALREYLRSLRQGLGWSAPVTIALPHVLVRIVARAGELWPGALFDRAAWAMLQRGNTADVEGTARALGRMPKPPGEFIDDASRDAFRTRAVLDAGLPVLKCSLAALWIWTGIVSMGLYPVEDSLHLLARAGLPEPLRAPALYAAAAFDIAMGVLTLAMPRVHRQWLWWSQVLLILFYTVVITVRLPEFWLHPYGPVLKNLPILALLFLLGMLDARPFTTASPPSGRTPPPGR